MSQTMNQPMTASLAPADTATMPLRAQGQGQSSALVGARHLVWHCSQRRRGERHASAMENFFQACATDEAFSLELVGTPREQGFLLRASSEEQLVLLCKRLSAQYPQADLQRLAPMADPLLIREGEQAVMGEFALINPSWMPLKTFAGKTLPSREPIHWQGFSLPWNRLRPGSG